MNRAVIVIGAGIVGVSCALELQRRGCQVTLIDRMPPGQETSYGNAGVLARSSLVPFNNPGLWKSLPRLLGNRTAQFRYDPLFLARNTGWAMRFLARANRSAFDETASALDGLIRLSTTQHLAWLKQSDALHRLRQNGWLFLYRSREAYAGSRLARETFTLHGIATETVDREGLAALEPGLSPIFDCALWVRDSASVDGPGQVVTAYAELFAAAGGRIEQGDVLAVERDAGAGWRVADSAGRVHRSGRVVVAVGPWAKGFLKRLRVSVPMAFERGYHMHYASVGKATLTRPVYDPAGAYVLSPMAQGLRLTTGVELAALDAPKNPAQLDLAERAARQAIALGERLDDEPWLGSRPTLPDSRPIIGEAPRRPGLWLAIGHQHIGFSTGPGTACVLASLMLGETCPVDPHPFRPARFLS